MMIHSPKIVHLSFGKLGDWREEIVKEKDCIAVVHGDELEREDIENFLSMLRKNNVKLAIENCMRKRKERIRCYLKELLPLIEGFDNNYVGLCYDTAHGRIANEKVKEWEPYVDRVFCIHLIDSRGVDCHVPAGQGDVDWNGFFEFLAKFKKVVPLIYEIEK